MSTTASSFWVTPELVGILLSQVHYRDDASRLARSCSMAWHNSFSRIWSEEPLNIPANLPRCDNTGVVNEHVWKSYLDHSHLVKSIVLCLPVLHYCRHWQRIDYPDYVFRRLEHLTVFLSHDDTDLERFLPPSLQRLDLRFNSMFDSVRTKPTFHFSAPRLINLHTCTITHDLYHEDQSYVMTGVAQFLDALPHPEKIVSLTTHASAAPVELLNLLPSFINLSKLALDIRRISGLGTLPSVLPTDPLAALAVGSLASLWLAPYRGRSFDFQSLLPFRLLLDFSILIDSDHDPVNLIVLRQLPQLQKVNIKLHDLNEWLTAPVFLALIEGWPRMERLSLLDSKRRSVFWVPSSALEFRILEKLAACCPQLEYLELNVDVSTIAGHVLRYPPLSLRGEVDATVHLGCRTLSSADMLRASKYLRRLYQKEGSVDLASSGYYWR